MSELSDLEICKRIAEIEGVEHVSDRGAIILSENYNELINTICSGRYAPIQVENIVNKTSYNPLTDDALCFQLMIKYGVRYEGRKLKGKHRFWIGNIKSKHSITNDNPNKAICLAIIEANKLTLQKENNSA